MAKPTPPMEANITATDSDSVMDASDRVIHEAMKIGDHIVDGGASVRDAMLRLEQAAVKLCLVVDTGGRLVRTLSDGDIRRALLSGHRLDDAVGTLTGRAPVAFAEGTDPATLADALDRHAISAVVLTDTNGHPTGLVDRTALQGAILLSPPHMGDAEAGYVTRAFDDNWIAPAGPNLAAFETRLATHATRAHAVALSSGTAGLHLALAALDLPRGTPVYLSDLTFAASLQPLLYQGHVPVLIDSEPGTWNMSPAALARRLARDAAAGTLPGAIMVVHLYGQSANLGAILEAANVYGVPVIEDAAESLGATYENRPSGAHGLISVYSFNGNKIITTSGGGALVTDDDAIAEKVRNLSTQGRDPAEHYQHSTIAYNYRMSNVLAGIGLGQLEVLGARVATRREIFGRYREGLGDIPGLSFQTEAVGAAGNRWLTVVDFDPDRIPLHPYQVMRRLRTSGIETRPAWKPMHLQPLAHGAAFEPHSEDVAVSAAHFLRALCLPSGSNMTDAQQTRVVETMRRIILEDAA